MMPSYWQWGTKETHASTPTVELAIFLAADNFSDWSPTLLSILDALGTGYHCKNACKKLNNDRICHSHQKSGEDSKIRQRQLRN